MHYQPSVVADTNIWRYLVDADAVEDVRKAAKAAEVDIVACPAVLYECLRLPKPKLRDELAKASPDRHGCARCQRHSSKLRI